MKTLTLRRFEQNEFYTLGNLASEDGKFDLFILERPWLNNKKMVSCIPEGEYITTYHNGRRFKDVWRVLDVENRTGILFHPANFIRQLNGCLAPCLKHMPDAHDHIVGLDSARAMQRLKDYIGRDKNNNLLPFKLIVTYAK